MATLFQRLTQAYRRFPGIGAKLAQRITFHILEMPREDVHFLTRTINEFRDRTIRCAVCGLISEQSPCRICCSGRRDRSLICVVKNVQDALSIERTRSYRGLYHVLGGLLSPVNNVLESDLTIDALMRRIGPEVKEIVCAFEQTVESSATIKTIRSRLTRSDVRISTLAIGIPTGTGIEYIDHDTLSKAIEHRLAM